MSSKLEYLSKYLLTTVNNGTERENRKKEKRRKSKRRCSDTRPSRTDDKEFQNVRTSLIQDMDDLKELISNNNDDNDDLYRDNIIDTLHDEDEGPTVVETMASRTDFAGHAKRGFERISHSRNDKPATDYEIVRNSRRKRHDTDSDSDETKEKLSPEVHRQRNWHQSADSRKSADKGNRYDSSDTEIYRANKESQGSEKSSKDSLSRIKSGVHDSNEATEIGRRHPRRHDSDSDRSENIEVAKCKKRHESFQVRNVDNRRHDSDSESSDIKMRSGHKSGLQSSKDFVIAEKEIRMRQNNKMTKYNISMSHSQNKETVYRDVKGKKIQTSNITQDERQQQLKEREKEKQRSQREANRGTYQKLQEEESLRKLKEASEMTFSRGVEDERLEERRKMIIREGDPMALHAWKKEQEKAAHLSTNASVIDVSFKPIYKGPPPKPNRYGICPGYRWDGIDRGNGFEDRVLAMLHSKGRKKEDAYKWSVADM